MPRKPKQEKQSITVVVNGMPVAVTLHPPTTTRKSWYAYWNGLVASKSTGQRKLGEAIIVAENMVKNGGRRADVGDTVLSDEEFEEIQRVHFGRKKDPAAIARTAKSLFSCLDSITAFRKIAGLKPITLATPDDCAAFQRKALTFPKNWRHQYPNHPWTGLGPWHWYWEWEHQHRTPTAHAPTLEAAMADFRKVWDSDEAKSQRA